MLPLNIQNTFSELWPLHPRRCDLNIAGLQPHIHWSIKDAVWVEKNMSTVSLHKGIPEGIKELHISKFRYWLVMVCCVEINAHALKKIFKRMFWNKTFLIISSNIRFTEERVATIAAPNPSIASNMYQIFKGLLSFLFVFFFFAYG